MAAKITQKPNGTFLLAVSRRSPGQKQEWFSKIVNVKTKREAEKLWLEFAAEIGKKPIEVLKLRNITLAEFYAYYKEHYALKHLEASTIQLNDALFERINEAMGTAPINKIEPKHILEFIDMLPNTGIKNTTLSANTVRKHYNLLKTVFNYAVKWEFAVRNPCNSVDPPKFSVREKEILCKADLDKFIEAVEAYAPKRNKLMLYLSFCLMLRRSEILGVQYKDINQLHRTLTTSRGVVKDKNKKYIIKHPKSKAGIRTQAIPNFLYDLIFECFADNKCKGQNSDDTSPNWLFPGRFDPTKPMHPDSFNNWLVRFCTLHGFEPLYPHLMRHMGGSYLLSAGIPLATVSKSMGHASKKFTLDTYIHTIEKVDSESAAIMDEIIKKSTS